MSEKYNNTPGEPKKRQAAPMISGKLGGRDVSAMIVSCLFLYFLAAVLPLLIRNSKQIALRLTCYLGALGSLIGLLIGIQALAAPTPLIQSFGYILPGVEFALSIDRLSGCFLSVISLVTLLTSLYSREFMQLYQEDNLSWWGFCYNMFILSMTLVVIVNNAVAFLIFWEIMTLTSYFLVTFGYKRDMVRKAGFVYIVMTHIGTVFIISAFAFLGHSAGWNFADLAASGGALPTTAKSVIFVCALIGFGTKAGVVPLHVWLPQAHPAAPTNVSAVMSGVMLKTAIYGMVRLVFDILGTGPAWWGAVVLFIGVVSAVIGVIFALMEHDMKRLLAFHSVENIGIILMGVGAGLIFYAWSMPVPAAIALAGGLFHVINHGVFKSLLFLCTGSVYYATHTKDIENLGGLIHRMPQTALFFLIGAISISAIPPFNGFASEYQIYQSLAGISYLKVSGFWTVGAILSIAALALTGALAAACFVKAFGVAFLALPRTHQAAEAKEVPVSMRLSVAPLAAICLVFGIVPELVLNRLTAIGGQLTGSGGEIPVVSTFSLNLVIALVAVMVLLYAGVKFMGGQKVRKGETWGCGIELNASMEYTAASFSQPIRRVYGPLLRPVREVRTMYDFLPYFNYRIHFEEHVQSLIRRYFYSPLRQAVVRTSKRFRVIQCGNINLYLGYIFATLILLLVWAR